MKNSNHFGNVLSFWNIVGGFSFLSVRRDFLFGQLNILCTRGESGAGKTENTKKVEIYSTLINNISEIIVPFYDAMKDDHDPECDQIGFDDFEDDQSYRW